MHTHKKIFSIAIVFILLLPLTFYSCKNDVQSDTDELIDEESTSIDDEEINDEYEFEESHNLTYSLPSPLQIVNIFRRSGLPFISTLLNSPSKSNTYNSKMTLKSNFGVYIADLSYCIMNQQNQKAINYLKALNEMSGKIWDSNMLNSGSFIKRFEKNMGDEDSLITIVAEMQLDMDTYLEENGMDDSSIEVFIGGWIETMHICLESNKSAKNTTINERISDQYSVYYNLMSTLNQQNDNDFNGMKKVLDELGVFFAPLKNNENVEDEAEYKYLSEQEIEALRKEIIKIRTQIVQS